jgi:hypothetical protein
MPGQEKSQNKWDIVVKLLSGGLIAAAVTIVGWNIEGNRQKNAEATRRIEVTRKFQADQKELDINLGMRMFETLMGYYLKKDKPLISPETAHENMMLLRLVALNFQDVPINLKPLFEQLYGELKTEGDRQKLKEVAMEVARRQAFRLTMKQGFDMVQVAKVNQVFSLASMPFFSVKITEILPDTVKAEFILNNNRSIGPIEISYFDMPLLDNLLVGGDYRASLLLLKTDGRESATVRLIAFDSYLAMDRFDLKESSRDLFPMQ